MLFPKRIRFYDQENCAFDLEMFISALVSFLVVSFKVFFAFSAMLKRSEYAMKGFTFKSKSFRVTDTSLFLKASKANLSKQNEAK